MTTTTSVASTTSAPAERPTGVRRVAGALSLPALFLALLATGPLDPFDDQAKPAVQLVQGRGHLGEVRALGWVEVLAALLMVGVVLTFAGLTRGRGRGVGNVAVVVGILGSAGMTLVGLRHWLLASLEGQPNAARVVDRLDSVVGPGVLVLIFASAIALLLFAIAGFRAGFMPLPAFILMILFLLGELTPALPGGELVPLLLGLAGFGWTAVALLSGTASSE
jgi:hypothetical protein